MQQQEQRAAACRADAAGETAACARRRSSRAAAHDLSWWCDLCTPSRRAWSSGLAAWGATQRGIDPPAAPPLLAAHRKWAACSTRHLQCKKATARASRFSPPPWRRGGAADGRRNEVPGLCSCAAFFVLVVRQPANTQSPHTLRRFKHTPDLSGSCAGPLSLTRERKHTTHRERRTARCAARFQPGLVRAHAGECLGLLIDWCATGLISACALGLPGSGARARPGAAIPPRPRAARLFLNARASLILPSPPPRPRTTEFVRPRRSTLTLAHRSSRGPTHLG